MPHNYGINDNMATNNASPPTNEMSTPTEPCWGSLCHLFEGFTETHKYVITFRVNPQQSQHRSVTAFIPRSRTPRATTVGGEGFNRKKKR